MSIYVVRHQQSEDNLKKIIQGPEHDSNLTDLGKERAKELAERLHNLVNQQNIRRIISSPSKRTLQTAEYIAQRLNCEIETDHSLVEVNPGIISGPKTYAEENYPNHIKTWNQRKDLDSVPNAERGEELQARAIYFLERFFNYTQESTEVVVSHAGFNRAMVNTSKGNRRTKLIGHSHDRIHLIKDPWKNMKVDRLELAKASQAYKVETKEGHYVMKIISEVNPAEMIFQEEVSKHVAKNGQLLSDVLYWGIRNERAIQILRHIKGKHVNEEPTKEQRANLFYSVMELGERLESFPNDFSNSDRYHPTLKEKLESILSDLEESKIKDLGQRLLGNPLYQRLVTSNEQQIVHYDLNRFNVLFQENNEAKILDLGSMVYSPKQFLPASLFMSFFMLYEKRDSLINQLIRQWEQPLNKEEVILLMQARALIGASFFQKKVRSQNYNSEDVELYKKYLSVMIQMDSMIT